MCAVTVDSLDINTVHGELESVHFVQVFEEVHINLCTFKSVHLHDPQKITQRTYMIPLS